MVTERGVTSQWSKRPKLWGDRVEISGWEVMMYSLNVSMISEISKIKQCNHTYSFVPAHQVYSCYIM